MSWARRHATGEEFRRQQPGDCLDGEDFQRQLVDNCKEMTPGKEEGADDCSEGDLGKRERGSTESMKILGGWVSIPKRRCATSAPALRQSRLESCDGSAFASRQSKPRSSALSGAHDRVSISTPGKGRQVPGGLYKKKRQWGAGMVLGKDRSEGTRSHNTEWLQEDPTVWEGSRGIS